MYSEMFIQNGIDGGFVLTEPERLTPVNHLQVLEVRDRAALSDPEPILTDEDDRQVTANEYDVLPVPPPAEE